MSAGASARTRVALTTLFGAWLASCSADVDGYHLDPRFLGNGGGSTSEGGSAGAVGGGSGAANSASGGGSGAGNRAGGGTGGGLVTRDGGSDTSIGTGGAEGGAAGATESGGADNGGTGSGGVGSGGTGAGGIIGTGGAGTGGIGSGGTGGGGKGAGGGGTGGTGAGGVGTGGTGAGGTGAGGTGAGGTGAGGTGAGGTMGTGGAGGGTVTGPVWDIPNGTALTGITAGAWRPEQNKFYLLQAAANRFWTLDVATDPGTVAGPYFVPAGTVAPRAFGASQSAVYVVIGDSVYRLPQNGNVSASALASLGDVPAPNANAITGAFGGGYFFIGEETGASHAVQDSTQSMVSGATALTKLFRVVSDGSSFAFHRTPTVGTSVESHWMQGGTWALDATPCTSGSTLTYQDVPLGIFGTRIAWVTHGSSAPYTVRSGVVTAGACVQAPGSISFGTSPNGEDLVGLIDDQYALVISAISGHIGTVEIKNLGGFIPPMQAQGVDFGNGTPNQFVMGQPHHAVVITNDIPALVSY